MQGTCTHRQPIKQRAGSSVAMVYHRYHYVARWTDGWPVAGCQWVRRCWAASCSHADAMLIYATPESIATGNACAPTPPPPFGPLCVQSVVLGHRFQRCVALWWWRSPTRALGGQVARKKLLLYTHSRRALLRATPRMRSHRSSETLCTVPLKSRRGGGSAKR